MQFFISLLLLLSSTAAVSPRSKDCRCHFHTCYNKLLTTICGQADSTFPNPAITIPFVEVEPRDLVSDIGGFTSAVATVPSWIESLEASRMSEFSSGFANITSSAASVSSSLSLQLSTADAAASTSIHSQLSQVAANVSSASVALQAAQSAVDSASTSSSATKTSTGGVGCAQTAAVGMGALLGGMAAVMQL